MPGANSYQDPELGLTANDALVAGLYLPASGLDVSPDLGCNWSCIGGPLAGQQITDIVVRPDSPHRVLALAATPSSSADAGNVSQVYLSTDDGKTWASLGTPIDPTVSVSTIDVSATDPNRIYVSANRNFNAARTASLFVSEDNGTTWAEHPVPSFNPPIPCADQPSMQCPSEDSIFVAAVDPTDADRVYVRSNGIAGTDTSGNSRLYVTTDAGKTFQIAKTFALPAQQQGTFIVTGEMLGFALTADGSTVYIGTKETGLWSAPKGDTLTFTQVNPGIRVQCLAARKTSSGQDELWACADEFSGFVFGKSTDKGKTFTPMMATVTSMAGPIACSATGTTSNACNTTANASACACSSYQTFCQDTEPVNACSGCGQDGGGPSPDDAGEDAAGGAGGGRDSGAPSGSSTSAKRGCSTVGGGGAAGMLTGRAIAPLAVRRRRSR